MLWTQSLISFAIWVVYGAWLWRHVSQKPVAARRKQEVGGPLLLLLGVALLGAGFFGVEALGGIGPSGLSPLGWLLISVVGIGFVHAQSVGAAWMAALAKDHVTPSPAPASTKQETEAQP